MTPRLVAVPIGLALACHGAAIEPTPKAPPETVVTEAPSLPLPGALHPSHYEVVRADPRLGPVLDGAMIPALLGPGTDAERVAAFQAARTSALEAYAAAEARGETVTLQDAAASADGPSRGELLLQSFDRVSTDVLEVWFKTRAKAVVADPGPVEARIRALEELETLAGTAFPWAPGSGKGVVVDLKLARAGLESPASP